MIDCYDLDRSKLHSIAAKIGPEVSDILGEHDVDPRIVEHFHVRGGYRKSYERIDTQARGDLFERDLAKVSSP
jgi:hypothetical protein